MSTAKNHFSGNGNIPPEKTGFAKTFNRLSSFIKEKGSLRELGINSNFDVIGKPEISPPATIDLLNNMENSAQKSTKTEKSINLPQYVTLDSSFDESKEKTKSKTTQMTIFYRGKVMVFDNISGDKARDLILTASGASNYNNRIQNRVRDFGSQEDILSGFQVNGLDLPIARRGSLHKFLAKRKDRPNVRAAPYELHNPLIAIASSSNYRFDLNL